LVIVDTTVWIDYLNGFDTAEPRWLDRRLTSLRFGLLDLMLCEVLQGLSSEREAELVLAELQRFSLVETGGARLAIEAARNYRELRRHGRTVRKTIDCLIATACILGGHVLLHNDRDFDPFEELLDLRVVHP
jgi:predicted nucleic acid-binding protein